MNVCVEKKKRKKQTNNENNTIRHKAQVSKKKEETLVFFTQIKQEFLWVQLFCFRTRDNSSISQKTI